MSVGDLAAHLEVPKNYLSKTLHLLARDGVLRSTRGKNGGFRLARPAKQIPLIDIIGPFERLGERRGCVLGRPVCSDSTPCAAHDRWKEVAELTTAFFERTTLNDLITPSSPVPPAGE
jgi:Rrf2 family protein